MTHIASTHRSNNLTRKETFAHNVFFSARRAISHHASGGNVLMLATALALIAANIPGINTIYNGFWSQEIRLQIGDFNVFSHAGHNMSVLQFINDALMSIFFFNIGLEIKREILVGELSSLRQALLPVIAATGGMIAPVGLYMLMADGTEYMSGAAIPMATDIAFSLGIIALLGPRVPISLKLFLTTLAVVDDIGGIIVIATLYTGHLDMQFIGYAAIGLLMLITGGSVLKIQTKMFYFITGGAVWYMVLHSGLHPTIAGVLVALCIPATPVYAPDKYIKEIRESISRFHNVNEPATYRHPSILSHEQMDRLKRIETASDRVISPLQDMEDQLHPLTDYLIIPLFAFANAGICLHGFNPVTLIDGISLAIFVALVVGKFTGILLFSFVGIKSGIVPMPEKATWGMMSAASLLGGIGFTVSLFIASLTFDTSTATGAALLDDAKLGIVAGSLVAGIGGYLTLRATLPKTKQYSTQKMPLN